MGRRGEDAGQGMVDVGMKALLAVTTYNQLAVTLRALETLRRTGEGIDRMFVDDASVDGTAATLARMGETVLAKQSRRGLTHSWNAAYERFKHGKYDAFILSNNDICLPDGALKGILAAVGVHTLVCPMTSVRGAGHNPVQAVSRHFPVTETEADDPERAQSIQDRVGRSGLAPLPMRCFNGFFFAMNRQIARVEFSDGVLFDPRRINIGNDDDLNSRLKAPPALCRNAFVYHSKAASFAGLAEVWKRTGGPDPRNRLDLFK